MMEIERSFSAAEVSQVDLRIGMGDLTLAAGSGDQIRLKARLRSGDETELETSVAGGVLTIKNRTDNGWMARSGSRIDVALTLPHAAAIEVMAKTALGDVNSDGVPGLREVHTGKGDVRAVGGSSPLSIKTGKGDVTVRAWRGDLDLTTGKGDATVSDLVGGLQMTTGAGDAAIERWQAVHGAGHQVKTGSGDVTISLSEAPGLELTTGRGDGALRQVALRSLRATSGFGDFAIAGDPLGGSWEVRTGKGDLVLTLPAAAAARVEAATRHGNLHSDLPQVKVARPGPASPRGGRTIMVIGEEPRAEIRLETIKGDISVRAAGSAPVAAPIAIAAEPAAQITPPQTAQVSPPAQPALMGEPVADQRTALTVLESLARGEISVDEAETLLRSLG